eukprot:s759_g5.t1
MLVKMMLLLLIMMMVVMMMMMPLLLCWWFLEAHQLPSSGDVGFGGDCSCSALFLSWPPRSEAAASALRSFSRGLSREHFGIMALMPSVQSANGLGTFFKFDIPLTEFASQQARMAAAAFHNQRRSHAGGSRRPGEVARDLEALPALSAAAAAAAFDAAGIQPEVLRSLLQEQQRFAGVAQTEVPAPSGPEGPKTAPPLVISVSEALGTTEGSGESTPKTPKKTTVMLRNLPNNYTRSMVLNLLNQEGFKGKFDFLYLPIDFRSKAGLGYAFVNLVEPSFVPSFWKAFDGYTKWVLPSSKVCQVSWSGPHQGQKAHVDRYRSSRWAQCLAAWRANSFSRGHEKNSGPTTQEVRWPARQSFEEGTRFFEGFGHTSPLVVLLHSTA